MSGLSAAAVPLDVLAPPPAAPVSTGSPPGRADPAKRLAIEKAAKDFEASFINAMLEPMFEGVSASAPFGGGQGEEAFKSFLTEAFAKQMTARGGLGVAASVQREMLKLQGLT
jgi:flagellar protein FlgJ